MRTEYENRTFNITKEQLEKLNSLAKATRYSRSSIIRILIDNARLEDMLPEAMREKLQKD